MAKPTRNNARQGGRDRPEDQHGEKTRDAFIEDLHGKHGGSEESEGSPQGQNDTDVYGQPIEGQRRLHEDRQQHDEAEKNSESNRLRR